MPSILYSVSNNVELHIRLAIGYISYFLRAIISDKIEFRSFRMPFEEENFFGCTKKKNLCLTSFFFKIILHLQTRVVRQHTLRAVSGITAASTALN